MKRRGAVTGTSRAWTGERVVMRSLTWAERCAVDEARLTRLCARLDDGGPMAIRDNTWGFDGVRARIDLDDDTRLLLKMYWKRHQALAALVRMYFHDDIGWVAVARTTAGDEVTIYAHHARIEPIRIAPAIA